MREIVIGIIVSALIVVIVSLLMRFMDFAFGVVVGMVGSLFWVFSLNSDVKKLSRSGNINRVRIGYLVRLAVSAGILGIAFGISTKVFFGACLGLLLLKIGAYMSFLFSTRRENNGNKVEFIKER